MAATSQSDGVSKNLLILQIEDNRADAELALLELSKAGFEVSADVVDTLADVARRMAASSTMWFWPTTACPDGWEPMPSRLRDSTSRMSRLSL